MATWRSRSDNIEVQCSAVVHEWRVNNCQRKLDYNRTGACNGNCQEALWCKPMIDGDNTIWYSYDTMILRAIKNWQVASLVYNTKLKSWQKHEMKNRWAWQVRSILKKETTLTSSAFRKPTEILQTVFFSARRCVSAAYAVVRCLFVCLSVCLSCSCICDLAVFWLFVTLICFLTFWRKE